MVLVVNPLTLVRHNESQTIDFQVFSRILGNPQKILRFGTYSVGPGQGDRPLVAQELTGSVAGPARGTARVPEA